MVFVCGSLYGVASFTRCWPAHAVLRKQRQKLREVLGRHALGNEAASDQGRADILKTLGGFAMDIWSKMPSNN